MSKILSERQPSTGKHIVEKFDGREESFLYWRTKLEAFVTSIYPDFDQVLAWAEEEDSEITPADLRAAFGPTNPTVATVDNLEAINAQLFAVLQSLCDKEAFNIIRSAGRSNGVDGWRRLVKRFDPFTGGRRRTMLQHLISPSKVTKLEDLSQAIETWEDQLRIYESRRKADGTRHRLDDEIKIAVMEKLVPTELEKHLQLNRTRYTSYDDVRAEVVLFLESRLGHRPKMANPGDPNAMDVGAFEQKGKGKGKKGGKKGGKGKSGKGAPKGKGGKGNAPAGKETRTCNNCGKVGHLKKDCWSSGGGAANKGQKPKGSSSGSNSNAKKTGKGGKGVSNLEEAEPEAETAETGYLSIAMLEEWSEDEVKEEVAEERQPETGFINVQVEPERYVMVKAEETSCSEPCDMCFHLKCGRSTDNQHFTHECNVCEKLRRKQIAAATSKGASKKEIREDVRMRRPESFHYIVDKTICLFKGISHGVFNNYPEDKKDELRSKHDPLMVSRDGNAETVRKLESTREDLRINYFEKVAKRLVEGASQTFGLGPTPEVERSSRSSGSAGPVATADIPSRPIGAASSQAMHRTIELQEVANLDAEKREKFQELEEAEDEEALQAIHKRIAEIDDRKAALKIQIRENDRVSKETTKKDGGFKLTAENVNDQSWHDARYHAAVKKGVSHSKAWAEEKKRRKATLHRQSGGKERAIERLRLEGEWHKEFDSKAVKEEEFHDETLGGIETEAVVEDEPGKLRVLKGKAKQIKRGELKRKDAGTFVKSARSYRKLTQDEVAKFKTETKEDELRVMNRPRVNIFKKLRNRIMTKVKKEARKKRVKAAKLRKKKATTLEPSVRYSEDFYLHNPHGNMMCADFRRSYCGRGAKCKMGHSELDRERNILETRYYEVKRSLEKVKLVEAEKQEINSFEDLGSVEAKDGWTKLVVNFDTGAAVTAVPKTLADQGLVQSDGNMDTRCYKTASGEILEDGGGVVVKGLSEEGFKRSLNGRLVGVHRMLASGTAVAKNNLVVLDGKQGWIIPRKGKIAEGMKEAFDKLVMRHPQEAEKMTQLYEQKGIFVFNLWVDGTAKDKDSGEGRDLAAMDEEGEGFSRPAKP